MQYRTDAKTGDALSVLGFGCMRFPRNAAQTESLIVEAAEKGINYFDTAYIYGQSEETLGAVLHKNNLRGKIFLATKLPLYKCRRTEDFDTLFHTQLERLKTDYIDYYLMHNLSGTALWQRMCALGIEEWIAEKKAAGQIRRLGFSFHGIHSEFLELLEAYPWDICQKQYNYVNVNYQAGAAGLQKAFEKGLPVIIMEPLLGGRLANALPAKAVSLFKSANPSLSPAAWALRWLWDQKAVTVVLSGMNAPAQLSENIALAQNALPETMPPDEKAVFGPVFEAFSAAFKVPCTGCNYCMPCPQNVNIPACFTAYNMSYAVGLVSGLQQYATSTAATADPQKNYGANQCVKCGRCEKHCPQHIQISACLEKVAKRMEPFWFKTAVRLMLKLRG
jgi:predicted aldo/keto reductase-like oxidoreductase